jgi:acyl dehydratase
MSAYQCVAINHSQAHENRIHSDDVARAYGFTGALVPGVAVFGHMTHPLTNQLGLDWLGHSNVALRLLKPAYNGDRLSIPLTQTGEFSYRVECYNAAGVLLAQVTVELPRVLPPIDPRSRIPGAAIKPTRVEIAWNVIDVDVPFAAQAWTPTTEENTRYTNELSDDLPLYRTGVVHPHLIQHWCNQMLVRRFILPAWIHVGTEMTFRRVLKVGDAIDVRAIPIEKWERKGHEFIKLYLAFLVDGAPAVEAYHTAIYKVAPKAA